jgi:hypothetical protein
MANKDERPLYPSQRPGVTLSAALLQRRALSRLFFDEGLLEDEDADTRPYYSDRAHDVPDGASRYQPLSTANLPPVTFPSCVTEAATPDNPHKYGRESPCAEHRLGPGGVATKSITLD